MHEAHEATYLSWLEVITQHLALSLWKKKQFFVIKKYNRKATFIYIYIYMEKN